MEIDFNKSQHVYFMGIGGISMSGLAKILLSRGFKVSGSDRAPSELTDQLAEEGALINIGQRASNITEDIDLVVYTAAIHADNPEFIRCKELSLPMMSRAEFLGLLMKNYSSSVAISGTHGKTTTTALLTQILLDADFLRKINISAYMVNPEVIFKGTHKARLGILNVYRTEAEHVVMTDEEKIKNYQSFKRFGELLPADGVLLINAGIKDYKEITDSLTCKVVTFAKGNEGDYYFSDLHISKEGYSVFNFNTPSGDKIEVTLRVPGEHNVLNAVAALALADILNLDLTTSAKALFNFEGAKRRFEYKGSLKGVNIFDDYAHHPTEIKATLQAASTYPHKNMWVVFQPHTYSRTKAFMDEFAEALALSDNVVLTDIYAARENDNLGISSEDLRQKIENLGKKCWHFKSFSDIEDFLLQNCIPEDMLITMGAGDVLKIGENLLGS